MTQKYAVCRVCGTELTNENWRNSFRRTNNYMCKKCDCKRSMEYHVANRDKVTARMRERHAANRAACNKQSREYRASYGGQSMSENKKCPLYLGVHVAERVLVEVFDNVQKMPHGNIGFDFICNQGKMIDVKSACMMLARRDSWSFHIAKNKIADYFMCIALDNRDDLNPLYLWLIPGDKLNHLRTTSISAGTIHKWDEYKLDINKVITCCDALKS